MTAAVFIAASAFALFAGCHAMQPSKSANADAAIKTAAVIGRLSPKRDQRDRDPAGGILAAAPACTRVSPNHTVSAGVWAQRFNVLPWHSFQAPWDLGVGSWRLGVGEYHGLVRPLVLA